MPKTETRTQIFERMYGKFSNELKSAFDGDIDAAAWISLVSEMMAMLKKTAIPNQDKKKVLIDIIKAVINQEVSEDKRANAIVIVDTIVSPGIDLAASFGKASFNKCMKKCC